MVMSGDRSAGLPERWRLGPSEVVAVVGAGGKSSLLEALARAYEAEGAHVVLTTTTKVRPPGPGGRPLVVAETIEGLVEALAAAAGGGPFSPLVGRRVSSQGKLQGLPSEWIPVLRDLPGVTAVLVEADGSLGRPLKAPAAWEPVLPSGVSLVAGVAGLEAQGVPLDDEHVHRPELLAALLGREVGAILPPASLLDALERGYAEAVPAGACFLAYLNKADLAPPAAPPAPPPAAGPNKRAAAPRR